MAVVVQCFHCNAVLELDDGFRGGVCRCSACGALLEVPKAQEPSGGRSNGAPVRPATPSASPKPSRSASPLPSSQATEATGLSSGLAGIERTKPVAPAKNIPQPPALPVSAPTMGLPPTREGRYRPLLWLSAILSVLIVSSVLGLVYWYMMSEEPGTSPTRNGSEGAAQGALAPINPLTAPTLAGIPLTGRRVIISVDTASSMVDSFDFVRRGILRAVDRLDPAQQITVVLWTDSGIKGLPRNSFVTAKTARPLRELLESTSPMGASNTEACIRATLGFNQPNDQIVLITAKAELPAVARADALLRLKKPGTRFDVIRITPGGSAALLENLAEATGGTYLAASAADLDIATR